MPSKALISSCSNKFFPSVINLLGSIKANYPNHPPIYVYDLGLFYTFRKELEMIEGVTVIPMPHFCPHWRACYTWKTYIFAHPLADLNFYIDAGCQVLKPLDEDFEIIEKDDLLLIDIFTKILDMTPKEYRNIFDINEQDINKSGVSAGIIGFKNTPKITKIFKKTYDAGKAGLTLGFSKNNLWRNKGKDKNIFIRSCDYFRHDQTIINILLKKYLKNEDIMIRSHDNYTYKGKGCFNTQRIWHLRLAWKNLDYLKIPDLHKKRSLVTLFNRLFINIFVLFKNANIFLKKQIGIIKS